MDQENRIMHQIRIYIKKTQTLNGQLMGIYTHSQLKLATRHGMISWWIEMLFSIKREIQSNGKLMES